MFSLAITIPDSINITFYDRCGNVVSRTTIANLTREGIVRYLQDLVFRVPMRASADLPVILTAIQWTINVVGDVKLFNPRRGYTFDVPQIKIDVIPIGINP